MKMQLPQEAQEGRTEEGRLVDFASGIIPNQEHRKSTKFTMIHMKGCERK